MSQKVTKLFSKKKTPPSKDATWGFWSKKVANPWGGGEFAVVCRFPTILQGQLSVFSKKKMIFNFFHVL